MEEVFLLLELLLLLWEELLELVTGVVAEIGVELLVRSVREYDNGTYVLLEADVVDSVELDSETGETGLEEAGTVEVWTVVVVITLGVVRTVVDPEVVNV